jgi:hypothetical protein
MGLAGHDAVLGFPNIALTTATEHDLFGVVKMNTPLEAKEDPDLPGVNVPLSDWALKYISTI